MTNKKNLPPDKEARLELEEAIDDLLEIGGGAPIYRSTSELLKFDPEPPICSFCAKGVNQVSKIFNGNNNANICDQCVVLCAEIVLHHRKQH